MSYADRPDLKDAYGTFRRVCEKLGYACDRITEKNAATRILPEILERIRRAAFIIVDLTDLRPNVFYELGYADGFGGKVIVTAKKEQRLPFDVKDIPTILWDAQAEALIPPGVRDTLIKAGALPPGAAAEDLRQFLVRANADFRDKAPVSAARAATIIAMASGRGRGGS